MSKEKSKVNECVLIQYMNPYACMYMYMFIYAITQH